MTDARQQVVVVFDAEGAIRHCNDRFLEVTGDAPDVVGETTLRAFVPVDEQESIATHISEVVESGEPARLDTHLLTSDGTAAPYEVTTSPLYASTGEVTGFVSVGHDCADRDEREREVHRIKQRLDLALEGKDTGVWEWNMETDEVTWTESLERLFGLEPGTFEGTFEAFADRVHPDDILAVEEAIETAIAEDVMYRTEFRIQRDDGEQIWGAARGRVLAEDGPVRMLGIVTDITERKETEQQYRRLTERISSGYYALDTDWNFTYWNDAMADRHEVPAEDIVGVNFWERYPEVEGTTMATTLREAMESGTQRSCEFYYEKLDYWTELQVYPDENGISVLSTAITERKEREQELERKQEFLEQTQEVTNVGGWEHDLTTDTLRWTDGTRSVHEVSADYVPDPADAVEFYHPDDRADVKRAVERCRDDGIAYDIEARLVTADGRTRWVETTGERIDRDDRTMLRGTIRDVTDRKQREQRLMVLNRVLRHNLRNNLTAVIGHAELLERKLTSLEELDSSETENGSREVIQHVKDATDLSSVTSDLDVIDQLVDLVTSIPIETALKDVRKIQKNSESLVEIAAKAQDIEQSVAGGQFTEAVAVRSLCEELVAAYREEFPRATIELVGDETQVHGNAEAFRRIVDELLENALVHSDRESPAVTLRNRAEVPETVVIDIEDTGPGMPKLERQTIEEGKETPLMHGSGIGLWLVNWLVTQLGGTVAIEDNEPRGTIVRLRFPLAGVE